MAIYLLQFTIINLIGLLVYRDGRTSDKKNKAFVNISIILLFLLEALRSYTVGQDTEAYEAVFYRIGYGHSYFWEPLYIALNRCVWHFTNNPQWLLASVAAITLGGIRFFVIHNTDDSENAFWPIFFFITLNFYFVTMSSMRQSCALAIGINAYTVLKSHTNTKSLLIALALVIIATLFHSSGIVMAILLPICCVRKINRRVIVIAVFVAIGIIVSFPLLMSIFFRFFPRYQVYLVRRSGRATELNMGNYILAALKVFILTLLFYSLPRIEQGYRKKELIRLSVLIILSISIGLLKTRTRLAIRLGYYFDIFMILLIPKFIKYSNFKNRTRVILNLGALIMGWSIYYIMMLRGSRGCVPYSFYWQY